MIETTTQGFAQVNPIATLIPPAEAQAKPQQQDVANAAHVLVAQFAQAESTQSRTRAVWDMARVLTCKEFDEALAKALETAKANDKAAGFTPASDAKGRDAYGPSQSALATVASQCRQVFGACKIDPESIVSLAADGAVVNPDLFPNWSKAYNLAREFLAKKECDWTGNPLSAVEAARKTKAKTNANKGILAEVMAKHPQEPGETMADYMVRIADYVEAHQKQKEHTAIVEAAKKELVRLTKVYGDQLGYVLDEMLAQHNAVADAEDAPQ